METGFYVIVGPVVDGERLFWSNDIGWADFPSATFFTKEEVFHPDFKLPLEGLMASPVFVGF